MAAPDVLHTMRDDWNRRAQEDANYYVAFGRRNQPPTEFFASAADQIRLFETELKRLPPDSLKHTAALEIGCGPGRLLRPLSRHFRHLHGIDISDEMLRRAEDNLHGIANVSLHHAADSSLAALPDASLGFIYSYAVFQHIPSRDVVFHYLHQAARLLTPGGLFVFQINGLSSRGHTPTTWAGCRVDASEIVQFAQDEGMWLLALTDPGTQYMWVTLQKPFTPPLPAPGASPPVSVFQVTNAYTGEPLVPASGRFGAASIWLSNLPPDAGLLTLQAFVDGIEAPCNYLSPVTNGRRFLNIILPPGTRTGLLPVAVFFRHQSLCPPARMRVVPPAPRIPSVASVADGINLLSANRIESGCVKLTVDEVPDPSRVQLRIGGIPLPYDWFCVNPLHERYEFNFHLPASLANGRHLLELTVGGKTFAPLPLDVVAPA